MAQFSDLLGHVEPIAHEDTRSALTLAQVSKKLGMSTSARRREKLRPTPQNPTHLG
jgi:hypothetical protein